MICVYNSILDVNQRIVHSSCRLFYIARLFAFRMQKFQGKMQVTNGIGSCGIAEKVGNNQIATKATEGFVQSCREMPREAVKGHRRSMLWSIFNGIFRKRIDFPQ